MIALKRALNTHPRWQHLMSLEAVAVPRATYVNWALTGLSGIFQLR